jgi:hypothetical protein
MNGSKLAAFAMGAAFAATSCARHDTPAAPASGPRFVAAPPQAEVKPLVRDALAKAASENRKLVVYVGAKWCEPCERMHRAVEKGDLDAAFPNLTFFEFDLDQDKGRLGAAGYSSKYIPLFALPDRDGKASGKQVEGGIKGEGAVGHIVPQLQSLLAQ